MEVRLIIAYALIALMVFAAVGAIVIYRRKRRDSRRSRWK